VKDEQGTAALSSGLNADKQAEKERYLSRPEKLPNGKYRYRYLVLFQTLLPHTF
jgi:hypothetical protein